MERNKSDNLQKSIQKLEKTLKTSSDKSDIVSEVMLSFQKKLDFHIEDNDRSFERLEKKLDKSMGKIEPALDIITTAKNTKAGLIWLAGFIGAVSIIMTSIAYLKDWIRRWLDKIMKKEYTSYMNIGENNKDFTQARFF